MQCSDTIGLPPPSLEVEEKPSTLYHQGRKQPRLQTEGLHWPSRTSCQCCPAAAWLSALWPLGQGVEAKHEVTLAP